MRWNCVLTSIVLAAGCLLTASPAGGAGFGKAVVVGGHSSDIALDQSRGVLYIANFTANRIDVMSTSDLTIRRSMTVAAQPGAVALSPDSRYLVIAHFRKGAGTDRDGNLLTVVNLESNERQTFATGDSPLGLAFLATGKAMVVTTAGLLLFDPATGSMSPMLKFANGAEDLPVGSATFPGEILETALASSGDGYTIWGVAGAGTGDQVVYRFDARNQQLSVYNYKSSPALLPRVSVSNDGSTAMVGYTLMNGTALVARYPSVIQSDNITGHAIDSARGLIYGQFPDSTQPKGPAALSSVAPAMLIMDADNLTVRQRIVIPENLTGRAVLDSSGNTLYAVSESGVMVLPVGSLDQYHRVAADREDILVQTVYCSRNSLVQSLTITDPGGSSTDFSITSSNSGVTVSPSSGKTPATVEVRVDPSAFQGATGTTAVKLTIASATAINQPDSVRVLVNNPDQDQHGTVVNVPGRLTDILPDEKRGRIYVLRQDKNQLMVFDAATYRMIIALRTATSPTMMAYAGDDHLLVGHNDSQLVTYYDLTTLQALAPVTLPGGHYARSIATSHATTLAVVRDESDGGGKIDLIDVSGRSASELPALGIYENKVAPYSVLTASPNGQSILLAAPDGNLMLYSADAGTFVASRKDFTSLSGAFAASSYGTYVAGDVYLNSSLVPMGRLSTGGRSTSGFAFTGEGGYLTTTGSSAGAGVIAGLATIDSSPMPAVRMTEAALVPVDAAASTSGSAYTTMKFTRTIAPLTSSGLLAVLTTSGLTMMATSYDSAGTPPAITSVASAADGSSSVAAGGLISVYGSRMSGFNAAASRVPLPTVMGESCLSVNGTPVPLLYVSGGQINAQLPFGVSGKVALKVHAPGGISGSYDLAVYATAPSIFRSGTSGAETGLATVVRTDNNQLVTATNPIHPDNSVIIYLTGMGATSPAVETGAAAPAEAPAVVVPPTVTLGGIQLPVTYAGLVPGSVGVYQIHATVPFGVPLGMNIPLVVSQGGSSTTVNVRVVK